MLDAGAHICSLGILTARWEAEARESTKDHIHDATARNSERPCLKTFYLEGENQHLKIVLCAPPPPYPHTSTQNKKSVLMTFACEVDDKVHGAEFRETS